MTRMDVADLAAFLARHPPFESVGTAALEAIAQGSRVDRFADGDLILDAFRNPSVEVLPPRKQWPAWPARHVRPDESDTGLGYEAGPPQFETR